MKNCGYTLELLLIAFLCASPIASDTLYQDKVNEETSASLTPNEYKVAILNAELAIQEHKFNKAIHALSELLKIDSTNSMALHYRAQAKNAMWDLQGALSDIDLSLKYGYDSLKAYALRRAINSQIGDHEQAANDCSHLIALKEWEPDYYFIRSQHYVLSGQIEPALLDYAKYHESIPDDDEKRQDEIRKILKELRKPYGPTVFADAWKAGQEAYMAWDKQDWAAMASRIQTGDLKKFKSRLIVAARAKGSIDFEYFKINGIAYKKSELSDMSPQDYFIFQMELFSRKQSPFYKKFDIRYSDVVELHPNGKNKALLRSRVHFGILEDGFEIVVQDKMKLEDGVWKIKIPKPFMIVANAIYNAALDLY